MVFMVVQGYSQTNLMDVKPWAYWLQSIDIQTIVNDTSFELIVIDYSSDGLDAQKWTTQQIDSVKNSGKYAISYISIGEAEDYRYYWQPSWATSPPSWLGPENPDWPGNYKVRFWEAEWQNIVFGYIDTIINQGFDGIYMDIIDAYYYWSVENPEQPYADSLMCQFILNIRSYANSVTGNLNFILIPQNGEDGWDQENVSSSLKSAYFNAINAVGVEDVFFPGDLDENNPYDPDTYRIAILQEYLTNNKQVYSVEYLTEPAKIAQYVDAAVVQNFVPFACTRALDHLCGGISLGLKDIEPNYINDIKVYPNPTNAALFISSSTGAKITEATIYNQVGQKVLHSKPVTQPIDVSMLRQGLYIIEVIYGTRIMRRKFIK